MNDRTGPRASALVLCAVTLVLATGAARAACRTGDSALADERALAAVRAALDDDCPCASFDGSPGSNRRDYRSCASDVIAAAQASDALSDDCVATAKDIVEGSVCGTRSIACATVTGTSQPRASCRLASASSCRSVSRRTTRLPIVELAEFKPVLGPSPSGGVVRRACAEQSFCADVVEWTAGTCVDTRANGPYTAGFRDVRLVKPSANDPGEERVLDAVVWYPTTPGAGPIDSDSRAVRDAPLDLSGGPYPVLMFSHGSCGFERQSLFLTPWLATHGFIVVATPHPGNTLFEFPDCRTGSAQAASAVERPRDIIFALDYILAANDDPASPFFGAVDESRLGMSGHSFGGLTTYLTTALDERFTVAMPMAAATGPNSTLRIPSLTLYGTIDSVVNNPGIFAAFERSSSAKRLVGIEDAGHYAFSDGCFPSSDCNPPTTLTQEEAHERVKRWVLPFLKAYLAGDRSFAPFLETAPPPGVVVSSQ